MGVNDQKWTKTATQSKIQIEKMTKWKKYTHQDYHHSSQKTNKIRMTVAEYNKANEEQMCVWHVHLWQIAWCHAAEWSSSLPSTYTICKKCRELLMFRAMNTLFSQYWWLEADSKEIIACHQSKQTIQVKARTGRGRLVSRWQVDLLAWTWPTDITFSRGCVWCPSRRRDTLRWWLRWRWHNNNGHVCIFNKDTYIDLQ